MIGSVAVFVDAPLVAKTVADVVEVTLDVLTEILMAVVPAAIVANEGTFAEAELLRGAFFTPPAPLT